MNRGGILASRHRRKHAQQNEDVEDGTQVERKSQRKKDLRRAPAVAKDDKFDKALRQFVLDNAKLGLPALVDEFIAMKQESMGNTSKCVKTAFDAHMDRNRYKDVICIDETRVVLKGGSNDYIHANWVHLPEKRRFICTQAPTEKTIEDFWRMIFQEKCRSIVMLCNLVEQGKKKCEQYWPTGAGESATFGAYTLTNIAVKNVEEVLVQTKLELSDGTDSFIVEQLCWNNWPDRGVPPNCLSCLRLLNRVKDLTPIVVHCSAGIGRTGTIVGLDILTARLQKGEVCTLEKIVRELREMRHGSVQMDIQYVYMVRVIIALAENKKLVTKAETAEWIANYETLCKARGC